MPSTCGLTSAMRNAVVRPGSSVSSVSCSVLSVTTLTCGGGGAAASFLSPHPASIDMAMASVTGTQALQPRDRCIAISCVRIKAESKCHRQTG
ncbi:hypothetical protein D3C72_1245060 [compost metagenome]